LAPGISEHHPQQLDGLSGNQKRPQTAREPALDPQRSGGMAYGVHSTFCVDLFRLPMSAGAARYIAAVMDGDR